MYGKSWNIGRYELSAQSISKSSSERYSFAGRATHRGRDYGDSGLCTAIGFAGTALRRLAYVRSRTPACELLVSLYKWQQRFDDERRFRRRKLRTFGTAAAASMFA